ncbi:hypothetical protein LCGC14_2584500, partial [marine sediment metagenome]
LLPLASAAAALIIVATAGVYLALPQSAQAAQARLAEIHGHNLSPHQEFYTRADPAELARYLKHRLGFHAAVPRLNAGMSIRGCCMSHFRGKPAGSYVVDTPRGVISVIVMAHAPESLGMQTELHRGGRTYRVGSFKMCNMAAVKLGRFTYCAVGNVPRTFLADLLGLLVSPDRSGWKYSKQPSATRAHQE